MKLLADESVDREIVERLRRDGHSVTYTAEMEPGISDDIVLQRANEQGGLLLTVDKDFGELTHRQKLTGFSNQTNAEVVARALRERGAKFVNAFGVISPGMIRIRIRSQKS